MLLLTSLKRSTFRTIADHSSTKPETLGVMLPTRADRSMKMNPRFNSLAAWTILVGLVVNLCAPSARAQSNGLQFEVASIKRSSAGGPPVSRTTPSSLTMSGASLRLRIQTAFDLPGYRVKGWPNWVNDRLDINAKVPESRAFSSAEVMSMLPFWWTGSSFVFTRKLRK